MTLEETYKELLVLVLTEEAWAVVANFEVITIKNGVTKTLDGVIQVLIFSVGMQLMYYQYNG